MMPNASILDIAAAPVNCSQYLWQRGDFRILGIDVDKQSIEQGATLARQKGLQNVRFQAIDLDQLMSG